jgi:hypothetical protein
MCACAGQTVSHTRRVQLRRLETVARSVPLQTHSASSQISSISLRILKNLMRHVTFTNSVQMVPQFTAVSLPHCTYIIHSSRLHFFLLPIHGSQEASSISYNILLSFLVNVQASKFWFQLLAVLTVVNGKTASNINPKIAQPSHARLLVFGVRTSL